MHMTHDADPIIEKIAQRAAGQVGGVVISIGYSPVVLRTLEECWGRGTLAGVIVAEARPGLAGRKLVAALARGGIPVALITDAQMGIFVPAASAALVAAEEIMPSGYVVGVTGTNLLALAAHRSHIPFYVLAQSGQVSARRKRREPFSLDDGDPREVLANPIDGVAVRNVRYDMTASRYISGYITEIGLLDRRGIAAQAPRPRTASQTPTCSSVATPAPAATTSASASSES